MKTKHGRRLHHKISIEEKVNIPDAIGGTSSDTWTEFVPAWAEIKPISGREFFSSDATQNTVSHRIVVRFRNDLKPNMRVLHKSTRYFNIVSVREFEERGRWTEMMCEELI